MYSFAQRSDTQVYDEPLYAYYLRHSNAARYHPMADVVMAAQENNGERVIASMMSEPPKPVLFFKHMAHHLLTLDRTFMRETVNVILTRDPVDMLPSFAQVVPNPSLDDVGYRVQVALAEDLQLRDIPVLVLEARTILLSPEHELRRLCQFAEIPFDRAMLSWPAGPRPEDGVWASHWYARVHRSTGFARYQPKEGGFPKALEPLLAECQPLYQRLLAYSRDVRP